MKKTRFLIPLTLCLCLSLSSCGDGRIWDFTNYNVAFKVLNEKGENLMQDSSNLAKVKVLYKGKEYKYNEENELTTRANPPLPLKIRWITPPQSTEYFLCFGEFSPTENYKGEKFTIDWGTGRKDEIKFDLYTTWIFNDPTVHKKIWLNGKLYSKNSFLITLKN